MPLASLPPHLQTLLNTYNTLSSADRHLLRPHLTHYDILGNLPIEIAAKISEHLDPTDPIHFRRVNHRWFTIFTSETVCSGLLFRHYPTDANLWKSQASVVYRNKAAHFVLENALSREEAIRKGRPVGGRNFKGLEKIMHDPNFKLLSFQYGVCRGKPLLAIKPIKVVQRNYDGVMYTTDLLICNYGSNQERSRTVDEMRSGYSYEQLLWACEKISFPRISHKGRDYGRFELKKLYFGNSAILLEATLEGAWLLLNPETHEFRTLLLPSNREGYGPATCVADGDWFTILYRESSWKINSVTGKYRQIELSFDMTPKDNFSLNPLLSRTDRGTLTLLKLTHRYYDVVDEVVFEWKEIDPDGISKDSRVVGGQMQNFTLSPEIFDLKRDFLPFNMVLYDCQDAEIQRLSILAYVTWPANDGMLFYAAYVDRFTGEAFYHRLCVQGQPDILIDPRSLRRRGNKAYYIASDTHSSGDRYQVYIVDVPLWTGEWTPDPLRGDWDVVKAVRWKNPMMERRVGRLEWLMIPMGGTEPRGVMVCSSGLSDDFSNDGNLVAWEYRGIHDIDNDAAKVESSPEPMRSVEGDSSDGTRVDRAREQEVVWEAELSAESNDGDVVIPLDLSHS